MRLLRAAHMEQQLALDIQAALVLEHTVESADRLFLPVLPEKFDVACTALQGFFEGAAHDDIALVVDNVEYAGIAGEAPVRVDGLALQIEGKRPPFAQMRVDFL